MKHWLCVICCLLFALAALAQDKQSSAPLPQKAVHETYIYGQKEFAAGSTVAVRVMVKGAVSMSESVPVPNANVLVTMEEKGELTILYEGKTDKNGESDVRFEMPNVPSGNYLLNISTASRYGKEKIQETIKVERRDKILLITDKPMYQPGQSMHMRALALNQMNLRPLAGRDMLFEVEDSKSNKVCKERIRSDAYGIAYTTFTLAEEVNTGTYRLTATLDENCKAEKTVNVEKYVLPKFKVAVTTDKTYFMPGEQVKGKIASDYFFGKPVAGGKVKLSAATFDVAFKDFFQVEGTTGEDGSFSFDFRLPDYLVGQPLEEGNALLKIAAEVTDKAEHSEKKTITLPVSKQALRIAVVAESGVLSPELINHLYVVTTYPDGRPASTQVRLEVMSQLPAGQHTVVEGKSDAAGIAMLYLLPKYEELNQQPPSDKLIPAQASLPLQVKATDSQGHTAQLDLQLAAQGGKQSLLVRPNRAIYRGGEMISLDVFTTLPASNVYLDLVKEGQTVLTKMLRVENGNANIRFAATSDLFGSIVLHAYALMEDGGTWLRTTRRIYVNPPQDIRIAVKPNQNVYRPGEAAVLHFLTTDATGKSLPSALGISIVDEAVYALQEMQPGLEKVYFTLEREIAAPKYQIKYGPADSLSNMVQDSSLPAARQKVATILLTQGPPLADYSWQRDPQAMRRQEMQQKLEAIFWAIWNFVQSESFSHKYSDGHWGFRPDMLKLVANKKLLAAEAVKDPFGQTLTMEELARIDKSFTYDMLGRLETARKIAHIYQKIWATAHNYKKDLNALGLDEMIALGQLTALDLIDAWGNRLRHKIDPNNQSYYMNWYMRQVVVYSTGPDNIFDSDDDVRAIGAYQDIYTAMWNDKPLAMRLRNSMRWSQRARGLGGMRDEARQKGVDVEPMAEEEGARTMPAFAAKEKNDLDIGADMPATPTGSNTSTSTAAPPRVREYFPETLLFRPSLITDKEGKAELRLDMADSITTWRLTASANSKNGALGGTTAPILVFQDFFVDIDFPVALTQNDEVTVPVAIYNYLQTAQTVRLVAEKESWFELFDEAEKSVTMPAKEVGVVSFRLRAKKIGYQRLTVTAYGSKMSDAVRRQVEIVPDGKKIEAVMNGSLSQTVEHTITIPDNAISDASKILVKCYPGVGAVLVEGLDGMLHMPGG
jgi:5-hydroxyisourate hydrolase-like protein (transthyretin family)